MTSDAIQRVAQSMPTHMLHSLSQVATYPQTPAMYINTVSIYMFQLFSIPLSYHFQYRCHLYNYLFIFLQPYTPSAQTPYMTPYGTPQSTPHQIPGTPRATPNASNDGFLHPGAVTPRRPQPSPASHNSHYYNQHQHGNSSNRLLFILIIP